MSSSSPVTLTTLGTLRLSDGGSEISAFHAAGKLVLTIGGANKLSVIDLSNPSTPSLLRTIDLSGPANSVAVNSAGLVAVAVEGNGTERYTKGSVAFFKVTGSGSTATITAAGEVAVGVVPDSIAFSPDGTKLVVANEGEPNELYTVDPEGTISVITINADIPANSTVATVDFKGLNGREAELRALGIRVSGKSGTTAAQDLEPEYMAISADGTKAFVTLQENNAVAVVDLSSSVPKLLSVRSLGVQDYVRGQASITTYDLVVPSPGTTSAGAVVPGGGLSGLYATGRDSLGRLTFLAPADRGPNGNGATKDVVKADGTPGTDGTADAVQPFLLPDYQARFYRLALDERSGAVTVVGEVKLTQKDGKTPITGRSNGKGDQIPVDANGNLLSYDPLGADLESIVQDKDGNIWMSDEYRPAIYKFSPTGQLIERYVPVGAAAAAGLAAGALGVETLPAEYAKRQTNRGFEGMAYDADKGRLYAFVQSPLDDVGANDGKKSSLIRILEVDASNGKPTAEYLYGMSGKATVAGTDTLLYANGVDKIGDVAYDATRQVFYVLERDSTASALSNKLVFEVSLKGATNILGNGVANEENLSIDALAGQNIKLANKVLITNLASEGYIPNDKPEGLALLADGRLAVINDNDFGVTALDATGYNALSTADKAKYALASDINGSKTYVWANPADARTQLGLVSFAPTFLDANDRDGGVKLLKNQNVYGLRMPDGIAAYQAKGIDGSSQTFTVIANEGDGRVRPDGASFTSGGVTTAEGAAYNDEQRTGVSGVAPDTRLKTIKDLGNYDASTPAYEQRFAYGGRSITILDSLGNVVWDSGDLIDRAAIATGIYDDGRSDDKGSEPENLAVATVAGRTYAFVGLERGTVSSLATFDITDPYKAYLVGFEKASTGVISPEGIVVIPAAQSPNGKDLLLVSNEVSKDLEIKQINSSFSLQILHYYGESGLLGTKTAPIMGALIDKFDDQFNTLVIGEGDSFIPGPWLVGGADPSLNASAAIRTTALGRPDIAIMNLFGTNVSALGNHEFDLGSPVLSGAFAPSGTWGGALFPFITSNLDFKADSSLRGLADASLGGTSTNAFAGKEASEIKAKIAPYAIVTKGGEKIGIVGATTWDLLSKSSPNGTIVKDDANAATSDLQEVAAYVQASVNALLAAGVNKVVMVDQLDGLIDRNKALAPLLSGVDVMVAGGGHERLGDANDVPVAFNGHDANFISTDTYPIVVNDKDGKPTVIVTTDTEYSYLGRLVVNFDANGNVITSSLDDKLNGAYAASAAALKAAYGTGQSVDEIVASSSIGKAVAEITSSIDKVISSKDGTVYGYTNVYLEGDRVFGRAQEVNLGNLTADANLFVASKALSGSTIVTSLKNGGGIRASVGTIDGNGNKGKPASTDVKPAGAISQLEIENALRFDNKLMVFDTTPAGLLAILNYAAGLTAGNGGYAQIGGIRFSFDPSKSAGQKVQDVAVVDLGGNLVAKVADNGIILADAPKTISMVTLNFMANGGDGYPIKANASNFRYLLNDGKLSAAVDSTKDFTAVDVVPSNALGEQAALQGFLKAFHGTPDKAYRQPDTVAAADQRIQNLSVKAFDTVFPDGNVPLLKARVAGLKVSELLTIGESVNGYRPTGTPDGMGAYLKDPNTIRLLVQSEITKTAGYAYKLANGTELTGARIHYLDIDKTSSQVIGGGLAYNKIFDRAGKEVVAATQISGDASGSAGFDRFCAANLIEANAFGAGRGFVDRIHLLGEESSSASGGLGGTMVALDVASSSLHALPALGFGSWEGATALDTGNTNQVAILLGDDYASATVGAPIYLYVGTKSTATGASFLERNGLVGGKLFAWVADTGAALNRPSEFKGYGATAKGTWVEIATRDATKAGTTGYDALGYKSAALLRADADSKNAFLAARIEDLDFNPNKPSQAAFVATGNETFDGGSDLLGTVYTLDVSFSAAGAPTAGTLKVVYDGDDAANGPTGLRSPDNIAFSKDGFLYIQEDKAVYGGAADVKYGQEKGSIWKLDPTTGKAIRWAQIDDTIDPDGSGGQALDKNDTGYKAYGWESSGIIDVSNLYGHAPGTDFFANVQTHGVKGGAINDFNLVAGGQIVKINVSNAAKQFDYVKSDGTAIKANMRPTSGQVSGDINFSRMMAAPSLTNQPKKLNIGQTGIDFTINVDSAKSANTARAAVDLAPLLDGLELTANGSKKRLAYFAYSSPIGEEAPTATTFTYDPTKKAGARFYDLDGNGSADTVDLMFIDGGYGDKDGVANGVVVDPSTAGVVDMTPIFTASANSLSVGDPSDTTSPASIVVRAKLSTRSSTVNQFGYVAFNAGESLSLDFDLVKERGTILFSNLSNSDVPDISSMIFQRDINLINGQQLMFFEVVDSTLETLLKKGSLDSSFRTLDVSKLSDTTASAGKGNSLLSLNLTSDVSGLGELISNQMGEAPVFDFTSLAGQTITGDVLVAREAGFDSTIGFYKLERSDGAVLDSITNNLIMPGEAGYAEAALSSNNLFSGFGSLATSNRTNKSSTLEAFTNAGLLAPFAKVHSTGKTYFSFAAANSDGYSHFRVLGSGVLGLEDYEGGGDRDHDDLIAAFNFKIMPTTLA